MLGAILLSIALGFTFVAGTAILLGSKKVANPGGPFFIGLYTGFRITHKIEGVILCAIAGIVGWLLYRLAVKT